jgi:hypothetical protein
MCTKLPMLGLFHLFVWDFWVTHVSTLMYLYGIRAGLSFEGSVKELQVDFTQNPHLMRGPSLYRGPTDAPQKVQHWWSNRTLHPGYALQHIACNPGIRR